MQKAVQPKVTMEKKPKRAGATPLFRLSAAQRFVGSLPPTPSSSGPCFGRVQESENAGRNAGRKTKPTTRRRKATWQSLRHHPNSQSQ